MTGKETPPDDSDVLDETTVEGKKKEKLRRANEKGYSELLLSVSDEVTFGIIDGARTANLPEGCLMTAWSKLERKFLPRTNATMIKLVKEFGQMSLSGPDKDPEEWITNLEYVRARLGQLGKKIEEEDAMIHILNNLPVEYENTVEVMERRLDDTMDPLTIDIIRDELSLKYEKIKRTLGIDEESLEKDETAFVSGYAKFKGRCYGCGKFGHKSGDCKSKEDKKDSGNSGKPTGTWCNYCKKDGHWKRECPVLAAKKKGNDVVNTAQDSTAQDDDFDIVLTSTEFSNNPYAILGEDEEDGETLDEAFLEQDAIRTFGKIDKDL